MLILKLLPSGTKRRSGRPILGVKGIVAHDTGNPNSTALSNVNYYINSANDQEASAHTFIDDSNIVECIPKTERALHVRKVAFPEGNDYYLGIELCYFPADKARSLKAYEAYVAYIRELCTKYRLDPKTSVKGHFQTDPSRRTDPLNAFKYVGKTWEQFIKDLTPEEQIAIWIPKSKVEKVLAYLKTI